jgi:predicted ester cyclase
MKPSLQIFAFYSNTNPDGPLRGLVGARTMIARGSALAEPEVTIEDIFGEGDRVAVRWTFRGTYRGEAKPGFPNPGQHCTIAAISTHRFVDGKIEDDWAVQAFCPTSPRE